MNIVFVCTGNTCRSAMAQVILNARSKHIAASMGTHATFGTPASHLSVDVCFENDIDLNRHRASPLSLSGLTKADKIYCMEDCHVRVIDALIGLHKHKDIWEKITILDIHDPFGGDIDDYRQTFKSISAAIDEIINTLVT